MSDFGARLRRLREMRGLSQGELAKLLEIDYMQVNRYERGINLPSVETAVRIARLLEISTDELLTGEGAQLPPPQIRNLQLLDRLRRVDVLPRKEQETAIGVLDGLIAKYELENLAGRLARTA